MYINEYPNPDFILSLLKTLSCDKKPMSVNINYDLNEISIQFRHNVFIDLFGDNIKTEEVINSPGGLIYEKKFYDDKVMIRVFTYINQIEFIEKKMTKRRDYIYNGRI